MLFVDGWQPVDVNGLSVSLFFFAFLGLQRPADLELGPWGNSDNGGKRVNLDSSGRLRVNLDSGQKVKGSILV